MIHLELVERGKELEREVSERRERRVVMVWNMFLSNNFIVGCDIVGGEERKIGSLQLFLCCFIFLLGTQRDRGERKCDGKMKNIV